MPILMSDFVRNQLASINNHMNGGYARCQSQYLKKLRVPVITSIPTNLSDQLLQSYHDRNLSEINNCVAIIIENEKLKSSRKASKSKPLQLQLAFE